MLQTGIAGLGDRLHDNSAAKYQRHLGEQTLLYRIVKKRDADFECCADIGKGFIYSSIMRPDARANCINSAMECVSSLPMMFVRCESTVL